MGEERKAMGIICKAGSKSIMMGREEIIILLELGLGILMVFLIATNVLKDYSWIIWLVAIVFVIYKVKKEGIDF